jgi:HlyD family secretion protein
LPVRITLDAFREEAFRGEVSYVSSFVQTRQEQNRTLEIEAEFSAEQLPENLLPGLSADVELILQVRDPVLRIPTYALQEGSRVLVMRGDELEEVVVKTGLRNWTFTEITAGLNEGDLVVVSLDRPEVVAGVRARIAEEVEQ